jgi:hypothetical protein
MWAVGMLAVGLIAWVVGCSQSFQECICQSKNQTSEQTPKKGPSDFLMALVRGTDLGVRCTGAFVEKNDAAITALSTLFIALFTLTLWRSTILSSEAFMNSEGAQ